MQFSFFYFPIIVPSWAAQQSYEVDIGFSIKESKIENEEISWLSSSSPGFGVLDSGPSASYWKNGSDHTDLIMEMFIKYTINTSI